MPSPSIIAIDGPAASGKSTLGFRLAEALGYLYFDTGLMYRAVTWLALQRGLNVRDEEVITRLAQDIPIEVTASSLEDGRTCDVVVDGTDITWDIRKPEVDMNVSIVAAYSGVREALSIQQRRIGLRGRVVMVGRDIGTVVLPEADLKIYLDASSEERARRRHAEALVRNPNTSYEEILAKVIERDHSDSTRSVAPLKPAEDAVLMDSDRMNADQIFSQALALCRK